MTTVELFAKSQRGGLQPTLAEHTRAVMNAFESLFGMVDRPTRLAKHWRRFFKLNNLDAFLHNGLAASAFHDIGKANDGFQEEVTKRRRGVQLIRHEHLSGLLLALSSVRAWLETAGVLDVAVIIAAVVSHHLKVSHKTLAEPRCDVSRAMQVYWAGAQTLLEEIGVRLRLRRTVLDIPSHWRFKPRPGDFNLEDHVQLVKGLLANLDENLDDNEPRRRLLWAVRAALIVADAAGSGLVREGEPVSRWIAEAFEESQLCDDTKIREQVIEPRLRQLGDTFRTWSTFQEDAGGLPGRSLLLAPCGSGKTLAAWRWIEAQLRERRAARVIFLYPTRASATEGFRDYVSFAPESDAALMHGAARYDLEGMFANPDDERAAKSFEARDRLFALKNWPKRIFSATVDQFLGFLQHSHGSTCQLPLLVDAVVVIDEVHSFDRGMFSALTDFLTTFDVPVLCMTATLPQKRQQILSQQGGLHAYNEKPGDLQDSAAYPRYKVRDTTHAAVIERVRSAVADGRRVLWVVNQVSRAQKLARSFATDESADELRTASGVPVFCYHSRYRLNDRVKQHRMVVEAFKAGSNSGGALAATTQVCEMSLDLDADLLVTEYAPITSLIQRMGRCCRKAHPKNGRFGEVLIYAPDDDKPYRPEELDGAPKFVSRLAGLSFVSHNDLETALEDAPQLAEPPRDCRFLTSGPYAMAGEASFRDIEQFLQVAVLAADIAEYLRLAAQPKERWKADGLILPVPKRFAKQRDARLPQYIRIAPDGQYLPALGFLD